MKLEMKSTHNEFSNRCKRNSIYINFHCRRNEMKLCFGVVEETQPIQLKANHFCFDKINACADASFHMTLFWAAFT